MEASNALGDVLVERSVSSGHLLSAALGGTARAAISDTFANPGTCVWDELTSALCPVTPEQGETG